MARESRSAPGGKAPRKPPGPLSRLVLLLAVPLPEAVSLHRLLWCVGACASAAGWALAALLAFTAPLSIPLLVWTALGADSKQHVVRLPEGLPHIGRFDISGRHILLPALSAPAAFALLAAASIAIHLAQAAWRGARQQRKATTASALKADFALRRPKATVTPAKVSTAARKPAAAGPSPIESPFSSHRRRNGLAADARTPGSTPLANGQSGGGGGGLVQLLFAQLAEVQQVVFGAEAAEQLAAGMPQTFENAVFETGRLCGIVGVDAPKGGGGSAEALSSALAQLKAAVI